MQTFVSKHMAWLAVTPMSSQRVAIEEGIVHAKPVANAADNTSRVHVSDDNALDASSLKYGNRIIGTGYFYS